MRPDLIRYRKRVTQTDAEHVRGIVESSGFFNPEEVGIAVELLEERLSKGIRSGYEFLFTEQGGRVVGYSCFGHIAGTRASYDLYWIAVHEDVRGQGMGKKLLARTEQEIARRGGRRIYIETSSREQYAPTRAFYLRCGYQQEALLKDFYFPGDSKVIYVKEVSSAATRG